MLKLTTAPIQKQTLSPRMQQSAQILQLSTMELKAYIADIAQENPLLDVDENESLPVAEAESPIYIRKDRASDEDDAPGELYQVSQETLHDHLMSQLVGYPISKHDLCALKTLIELVDERGFLPLSDEELSSILRMEISCVKYLRGLLQQLDPSGVGASCMEECLCIQLRRRDPDDRLGLFIVENMLDKLAKNQLNLIARSAGASLAQVKAAKERISRLNPWPGNGFSSSADTVYIMPDIYVTENNGSLAVEFNSRCIPSLHINEYYQNLIKQDPDQETAAYIDQKAAQAQWLITCINRRNQTLLRCTRYIVERSQGYFLGNASARVPISLGDVAQEVGVHPSTVSRALREKYVCSRQGIQPLSSFISRPVSETATRESICAMIQAYIQNESQNRPLTDARLTQLLNDDGVSISRRTVAKYRSSICFSSALRASR